MARRFSTLPLLPAPRELILLGPEVEIALLPFREIVDPALPGLPGEEMYTVEVDEKEVRLAARQKVGLRWARATLAQLQRLGRVPCLRLADAPRLAHRGVMLDISRNRVPTLATLRELVDRIASWKMNHLQLYVENTVAYVGHEEAWQGVSPMTLEELTELDAYAAEQGVALTANQNCLGHFERWLSHPRYAPLAEVDQPSIIMGRYFRTPNTLCPLDPGSLALVTDLLGQLLPRCSGNYANIGCDEPWDLGRGRSRERCAEIGRERVFSDYLRQVAEVVDKAGKKPQFWCDPHPNEDDGLPLDLVPLIWGYDASEPMAERAAAHRAAGREIWVAPGTSCWNSTTGRTWNRRANLDQAAAIEATGFLCTAWGDDGHRQPWPLTLAGFADAAMAAWSGPGKFDDEAVGWHVFGNPAWGPWLSELGNVDQELCRGERPDWTGQGRTEGVVLHNQTALWEEMNTPYERPHGRGDTAAWEEVGARLEVLQNKCPGEGAALLTRELLHGLNIARWTVDLALARRAGQPVEEARAKLTERMCALTGEFSRLWLARSRPGGLPDSVRRYGQTATFD